MRAECHEQARADPGYSVESLESSERAVRFAVGDNGLGQGQADAWEPGQLRRGSAVSVDALVGPERPGEGKDAVAMRDGRLRGKSLDQLDFAGRLTRAGGEPADPLAREPE
jgi:hypothetical protein